MPLRANHHSLLACVLLLTASAAHAGHHRWDFTEIFSNADGSVQYVELFSANDGEAALGPWTITSTTNSFQFVTNVTEPTANTWVLVATSNFASLPGAVTPDYIIPASFFPTGGGTLTYAGGADVWAYGAVPTDGVQALQRNGSAAANSPTNFAGQSGSVNLSSSVPAVASWAVALVVGAILLVSSGILRRRPA